MIDAKYFATTRVVVYTVLVLITRFGTAPNPLLMLEAASTPRLANWATMAKLNAVDNVACCRIVVLTALAANTHARRLLNTVGRTLQVATTNFVTIMGTPILTSLTMVPHNFNTATQETPKAVAQRPTRVGSSSPSKAFPHNLPPVPTG